jgi:hypothetical protein
MKYNYESNLKIFNDPLPIDFGGMSFPYFYKETFS